MSFSSLFDDFPTFNYDNGVPRRRRPRSLLYSVLDSLEDQIGQKVGQVFRLLPALTLDLDDQYENNSVGKKRKLRPGAASSYEPKSKVVVSNKDDKFKVTLDTSSYQPEELTVKVVNDKLAISAKHIAKEKDVYEFFEMYRSFDLPENIDPNAITSHLSASGQLTVEAPLKTLPEVTEITIPISIEGKEQQAEIPKSKPTEENKELVEAIEILPYEEMQVVKPTESSAEEKQVAEVNETFEEKQGVDFSETSAEEKQGVEASETSAEEKQEVEASEASAENDKQTAEVSETSDEKQGVDFSETSAEEKHDVEASKASPVEEKQVEASPTEEIQVVEATATSQTGEEQVAEAEGCDSKVLPIEDKVE